MKMLDDDRRQTYHQIEEIFGLNVPTIFLILTNHYFLVSPNLTEDSTYEVVPENVENFR